MFRFLKMQYQLGRVSAEKLREYCPRIITAEQYEEITGRPFAEPEPAAEPATVAPASKTSGKK
jgi:hypothetical protein